MDTKAAFQNRGLAQGSILSRRSMLAFAASALVATPAEARQCEAIAMPDSVVLDGKKLILNGMGLLESSVFNVDVYVAGLYVEARSKDGTRIASAERLKRIHISFLRTVCRSDMVEFVEDGFKKVARGDLPKLAPRLERLKGMLPPLRKGENLTLTYRPGNGVEVALPKQKAVIEGADFGRTLFLLWLGANPVDAELKRGLLGGACG